MSRLVLLLGATAAVRGVQNVLWLPLGDSITFGCTGPTIQDCHPDCGGYRVPLAFALSQPPLGNASLVGFNVTTMGTDTTGPSYVPAQWLKHCGFPGWTIAEIDDFLPQAFASNPSRPDLITIHLGTNDCNQGRTLSEMSADMNSLLNHTFTDSPLSHVFLADVIATSNPWNSCIVAFNAVVPSIVSNWSAQGMKVTFVPMYAEVRMCGDTGDDFDLCGGHQVHPTSAGYPRMASAFALPILKYFNRTS